MAGKDEIQADLTAAMRSRDEIALATLRMLLAAVKRAEVAGSANAVPLMWAALHVVKAAVSVLGGSWSDRVGRRPIISAGWLVYAVPMLAYVLWPRTAVKKKLIGATNP